MFQKVVPSEKDVLVEIDAVSYREKKLSSTNIKKLHSHLREYKFKKT